MDRSLGLIPAGLELRGQLRGAPGLVVEGRIEGKLSLDGPLTIGGGGAIDGEIEAHDIVVDGRATGRLSARAQIVLRPSAEVEATLSAPTIAIEDGARFVGRLAMPLDLPEEP